MWKRSLSRASPMMLSTLSSLWRCRRRHSRSAAPAHIGSMPSAGREQQGLRSRQQNPWRETTLMKDHFDDRPPLWQANLMKDHPDERPPWWETTLMRDHPDERPPWWKTLMGDHPDKRPLWREIILMRDHSKRPSWSETTDERPPW